MKEFDRVLIANRGEIAVRIIRTLRALGIESVAVYSDADVAAAHVSMADKAYNLPGLQAVDTYLNKEAIIEIALKSEADAIHPGYGFLAESEEFSERCAQNSVKFIGPRPESLRISGNKFEAKKLVEAHGVQVIPYSRESISDKNEAERVAKEIGFPVLLKASFGGGGRGIKRARSPEEVKDAYESSEREGKAAFGRFAVFIEKEIVKPRHIEVQILASDSGHGVPDVVHLGERECSIQRRYQKLIELSPSPVVDETKRKRITDFAIKAAKGVKYANAGTVEFLYDEQTEDFYYMEINSRLQVEHPVTEELTGVDLVRSQIEVASRGKLPFSQKDVHFRGCAIEFRINAENPYADFVPQSGSVDGLRIPMGPGVRVDTALYVGFDVPQYYDSLIAKLICSGSDFETARRRAVVALNEFSISGLDTTIPFHKVVVNDHAFISGKMDTSFIETNQIVKKLLSSRKQIEDDKYMLAALLLSRNQFQFKAMRDETNRTRRRPPNITTGGRFVDGI
jgi:acetyl-CoA/propionyl-CoA carboxylase